MASDVYVFDLHVPGHGIFWHAEALAEDEVAEHARLTLMFNRPGTRLVVRRAGRQVLALRKEG